ncbi:hypothetical protein PBT90_10575 [Algoriphagus halophytocola]|uniref:Uncharacterized protein n=1 Tax=Algoriphagus halophytocola TaxID=2991499 RepID=A0ABY6MKY0_9BACT|nr:MULTISPECIES: hypothetical protein [unclassified Algoriphagus]UZD23833.1 hypothetical protein OM944_04905 [Algoriphagus sp. TR-M5]WBL41200.1 hypothetical protein PBT90_10575 [Algoriphagus sp. TR-M9]
MLSKILLPHYWQRIGWILFLPSAALAFYAMSAEFEFSWLQIDGVRETGLFESADENLTNEVAIISLFLSLFFIAFSKEKLEDEYIQKIRLDSILFACYGYFLLNVIGALLFYGVDYLSFMMFNMFSIPVLFVLRFRWVMFRQRNSLSLTL